MSAGARPAYYALRSGGWRDYITLIHPPYTLWHLSYVAIGAGLAPDVDWARLAAALAAFFLAMGLAAHAFDELVGRPLQTRIPRRGLLAIGACSLAGAVAIGIAYAVSFNWWLLVFVAFGAFAVGAYNLELFGGRLHNPLGFALAWGAFPALTGYFAMAGRLRVEAAFAAVYAVLLSLAQQRLSEVVRLLRRRAVSVSGSIGLADGGRLALDRDWLLRAPETALQLLAGATVALGTALLLVHLWE